MPGAEDFRRLALAIEGTSAAPHFDRTAFRIDRIYATLAADGLTANLKFTPEDQELKCLTAPEAFSPVAGGWGRQGWTTLTLAAVDKTALASALETAAAHARGKAGRGRKK
jgi:hypothetical protein